MFSTVLAIEPMYYEDSPSPVELAVGLSTNTVLRRLELDCKSYSHGLDCILIPSNYVYCRFSDQRRVIVHRANICDQHIVVGN